VNWSAARVVAGLAALAAVVIAGLLRLRPGADVAALTPDAVVPLLIAVAALCVVGLARQHRQSVAWLASIAALSLATVEIAAITRAQRPTLDPDAWRWLSVALCLAAIAASIAAVAYAADPVRRLARLVPVAGGLVLVSLLGAGVWAVATTGLTSPPTDSDATPLGNLGVVTRASLGTVVLFAGLGLLGDARPATARARRRLAVTRSAPHTAAQRADYAMAWFRAFLDEISPGRSRAHRAALSERSRIARDLHADVVPAVRRALAEAERGGSVGHLAASLRDVLHEVDVLVGSEHAIQLEVGGIVPALEWLAERVEERSNVRVTMNVEEWPEDRAGQPPMEVAAAAFRVAALALENVIRHAPGSQSTVEIRVGPERVHLVIADDGPGMPAEIERTAATAGRRGLADMAAEASGSGASLKVDRGGNAAGGPGTTVTFDWPAALAADYG
jgi:signal transduction histidine kinase